MPSKRTPLHRNLRRRISSVALGAFARMQRLEVDSDPWWEAHGVLHRELQLKPWEWPAYEDEQSELYRELRRALDARGKA
jgi:hypothetical protein